MAPGNVRAEKCVLDAGLRQTRTNELIACTPQKCLHCAVLSPPPLSEYIHDEASAFPVAKHIGSRNPLLVDLLNPEMESLGGKWWLEEPLYIE